MPQTLEAVLAQLDNDRITETLTEAVEQYSPSYAEEPAMQVFASRLEEAGIAYLRQPVPSTPEETRANLIIELGPQPPQVMWVGHVDTVPIIGEEELGVYREDDILHGLGTSDMKSGCTAVIEAVTTLVSAGVSFKRGLCIALVVGEEEYGDGSEALLSRFGAPLTVIGEPTGLVPCVSHFGYYECRLFAKGARAHAALPEMGASAIHAMLAWLTEILESSQRVPFAEQLALNPREIRGGADLFAVAESCEAQLDIHVPPDVGTAQVREIIEQARTRILQTHSGCELDFEEVYWAAGYANSPEIELIDPVRSAYQHVDMQWRPAAFRSHSDGSLFHQAGSVPVICGPGRLEVAHTRGEHVSLNEVHQAARLYTALFYDACVR